MEIRECMCNHRLSQFSFALLLLLIIDMAARAAVALLYLLLSTSPPKRICLRRGLFVGLSVCLLTKLLKQVWENKIFMKLLKISPWGDELSIFACRVYIYN